MLGERVRRGELPPLGQRLPDEPYVLRPERMVISRFLDAGPGLYGGTLQMPQERPGYDPVLFLGGLEPLLWSPGCFHSGRGVEGNVLAGYEADRGSTTFTFHLRRGLRWSDGVPVTTDDVRFTYEDVLLNEEITTAFPSFLRPGGRADLPPAALDIVDGLTFRLRFRAPYGSFPAQLIHANWRSYSALIKPRHYLEQFHRRYASKHRLAEMMRAEGIPEGEWFNLFRQKDFGEQADISRVQYAGHPTLTPWVMTGSGAGVFHLERNPYYFKVDHEGRQLPYIDRIRSQIVQDKETLTSRALFGEFDYLGERASLRKLPAIAKEADRGNLKISVARMHRLPISFALNLTHADPAWRAVVRDTRFRRALVRAIDATELIETFYLGEFAAKCGRLGVRGRDVAGANRLLDAMGMTGRDGDGFRLGPDGEHVRIPFEVADLSEDHIPMTELVAEYWKRVGIATSVRQITANQQSQRRADNTLRATAVWAGLPLWHVTHTTDYLPGTYWGPLWSEWYESAGDAGEEPPREIRRLYASHERLMAAELGSEEAAAALAEILHSYRENIWTFNPVDHFFYPTFWSSRIKNVPAGIKDEMYGIVANMSMEMWYVDEDSASGAGAEGRSQ